ncbi:MAG: AbrB/MazE/SpoVT family DNA-binding domain-containing protein [Mangrovibacterium sp.]|jgi:antitoxin MazE
MKTKVQKWGNSLAIRIPKAVSKETSITDGTAVDISVKEGVIVVSHAKKGFLLKELLEKVTDENIHREISSGSPVGGEVW